MKRNGATAVANPIRKIEQERSGKKPISHRAARRVHRDLVDGAYETQLKAEAIMLRDLGHTAEEVRKVINIWRPRKGQWVDRVFADRTPMNVWWGSARNLVSERKDFKPVRDFAKRAGEITAEKQESVIHGSSTTGCMGLADRSFIDALRRMFTEDWRGRTRSRLYTIPLHWRSDKITETAAKNGLAKDRCPPHLKITDRTADFFVKEVERVITLPGGLGSFFEIFFFLISVQLRDSLCTVATPWKRIPPLFLIDFEQNLDWSKLEENGVNPEELGLAQCQWYWQDLFQFLTKNVTLGSMNQSDIDRVYIIRIGKGKNYDLPVGQHVGPRILYFETAELAAEFVMSLR